jgi:hypothetical protein
MAAGLPALKLAPMLNMSEMLDFSLTLLFEKKSCK